MGCSPADPRKTGQREVFRRRFGEDLVAYDRTRPGAPPVVFDEIVRLAELSDGSSVVEIGPGTSQATRPLAERGLRVLAHATKRRLRAVRWLLARASPVPFRSSRRREAV